MSAVSDVASIPTTAGGSGSAIRRAAPGRYLTFSMGGECFGLHVQRIREIIHNVAECTRIPQVPPFVKGCLNLRGTVIPVIDLRRKFQLEPTGSSVLNCIIVCEVHVGSEETMPSGLIVDSVEEVVAFKRGDLEPAPEFGAGVDTRFVSGMAKHRERLVTLLDLDEVFASATLQVIRNGVEAVAPEDAVAVE